MATHSAATMRRNRHEARVDVCLRLAVVGVRQQGIWPRASIRIRADQHLALVVSCLCLDHSRAENSLGGKGMSQSTHDPLDLVWGAAAIAKVIGQTTRATYHILEAGDLPARQVGRRWVASRRNLETFFAETTTAFQTKRASRDE